MATQTKETTRYVPPARRFKKDGKRGGKFARRHVNDGLTKKNAKRICEYCLVNECRNQDNDMLHLVGLSDNIRVELWNSVFTKQTRDRTNPVDHTYKKNEVVPETETDSDTTEKLPCKYCLTGNCDRWRNDDGFLHIKGCWYCPLNARQIENLQRLVSAKRNSELEQKATEYEDKMDYLDKAAREVRQVKKQLVKLQAILAQGASAGELDEGLQTLLNDFGAADEDDSGADDETDAEQQHTAVEKISISDLKKLMSKSNI